MQKLFIIYCMLYIVNSIAMDVPKNKEKDEYSYSIIYFTHKMSGKSHYLEVPVITRLAKELVIYYNEQEESPISFTSEKLSNGWVNDCRFNNKYKEYIDPSYDECFEVKFAKEMGISHLEYLRRNKDIAREMIGLCILDLQSK